MKSYKHCFFSYLLARDVHLDVFELGTQVDHLLLLFGGSGIAEEDYIARQSTVIPIFDSLLRNYHQTNLVLLHVTAPFDVPFARFRDHPEHAQRWQNHILTELLTPWEKTPFWVSGFSGGAVLALSGVHTALHCRGAAVFGADQLSSQFQYPDHWPMPLQVFEAQNDRVTNDPGKYCDR